MADASLIDAIKGGDYQASLITTFNAHLPFYEEIVLRKLVSNGVRHNVVMMDQAQCQASFQHFPPVQAGRRYTLLPMHSSGAFHPKILLLLGKEKGLLAIGSHNLTLSGFGVNRELTNLIRYEQGSNESYASIFNQVGQYLQQWLKDQGKHLPQSLSGSLKSALSVAPWMKAAPVTPDLSVIASSSKSENLLSQLKALVDEPVSRLIVGGAFFDSQLSFLKQLEREFAPDEFIVGVDAKTVMAPPALANMSGVKVVDASRLGGAESKYLHAKYLFVTTNSGRHLLATGSANPSAPAWLSDGADGNTEMMLVRTDRDALTVADELGLSGLADSVVVSENDWDVLGKNWEQRSAEFDTAELSIGVAVATGGGIQFELSKQVEGMVTCQLLNDQDDIVDSRDINASGKTISLPLPGEKITEVAQIRVYSGQQQRYMFFVHHEALVKAASRTSSQREFSDALASLGSSSPDLATLIQCVENIVVFKEKKKQQKDAGSGVAESAKELPQPDEAGFAADLGDAAEPHKKSRLLVREDMAYLLDVLIYHLGTGAVTRAYDIVDDQGRTEEAQVGVEDSGEKPAGHGVDSEILAKCHEKVKKLVGSLKKQLGEKVENEDSLKEKITKTLAVLALLYELRKCDGTQSWVGSYQTTFPKELRQPLLNTIMSAFYGGESGFLQLEHHYPEIASSDDVERLKGLIVWLAWDCHIELAPAPSITEQPESRNRRLEGNALFLALAHVVAGNERAVGYGRQRIGLLCRGNWGWINRLTAISEGLQKILSEPLNPHLRNRNVGEVVVHPGLPSLGVRVVHCYPDGGEKVELIDFASNGEFSSKTFTTDYLRVIPFGELFH